MNTVRLHFLSSLIFFISAGVYPNFVAAQSSPVDTALADQYFKEAQKLCAQDSNKLWSVSLCGPILFADRQTRTVVANQSDLEGKLTKEGDLFVGRLPENVNISNTAIDWAGVKWTMVAWPLPENRYDRAKLLAHELWHRIQNEIGLPSSFPANNHLDSLDGRIWLQLEWRALQEALTHHGAERRGAVRDVLIFRSYRRLLFPKADSEERSLEMNEGLAEYTGTKLSGSGDIAQYAAYQLKEAEKTESFVRSFAYASGPAYGILLDEAGTDWRKNLGPESDFGVLLQKSFSVKLPQNLKLEAAKASKRYGGDALRASETERENNRQKRIANYRARLVDGPVLAIPLQKMNMQLNPNNLQPLESFGTVYPDIRIVDVWGILTVSNGALMNPTFTKVYVPAPGDPSGRPVQGDGWALELNPGWTVVPGERKGDYILKKSN